MRTLPVVAGFLAIGALPGCRDVTTPLGGDRAPRTAAMSRTKGFEAYFEVKKNGRTKLYRMRVNKATRTMDLRTIVEESDFSTSSDPLTCDDFTGSGCENPGDPGSGGTSGTGVVNGELEIDGINADTVELDVPWEASYSTTGWDGSPYHCPGRDEDTHFHWKDHYFETEGISHFMGYLPSSVAGVVKGRYLLTQGPWLSTDGRARIWSGTVDANCYYEYTTWATILLVEYGSIVTYKFSGDYEEFGSGTTFASQNGGQYGGTVYTSLDEVRGGDPAAYEALQAWLEDGTCSDGWVIIVDGKRVC